MVIIIITIVFFFLSLGQPAYKIKKFYSFWRERVFDLLEAFHHVWRFHSHIDVLGCEGASWGLISGRGQPVMGEGGR